MKRVPLDPNKICTWCGHAVEQGKDFYFPLTDIGTGYCSKKCFYEWMEHIKKERLMKLKYPHGTGQTRLF